MKFFKVILFTILFLYTTNLFAKETLIRIQDFDVQLKCGYTHIFNNNYLYDKFNEYLQITRDNYTVTYHVPMKVSQPAMNIALDFNLNINNFTVGLSSGVIILPESTHIIYRRDTTGSEYGKLTLNPFFLPEYAYLGYKHQFSEHISLSGAIGGGYYLLLEKREREIILDSKSSTNLKNINNKTSYMHNAGINCEIEFSYKFSESFTVEVGCQGHFIFMNNNDMLYCLNVYLGLTEYIYL